MCKSSEVGENSSQEREPQEAEMAGVEGGVGDGDRRWEWTRGYLSDHRGLISTAQQFGLPAAGNAKPRESMGPDPICVSKR